VVGGRLIVLCIERDLGTERSEVLAAKIRRYQALARRGSGRPLTIGFVVDSQRRARTIRDLTSVDGGRGGPVHVATAEIESLSVDPFACRWTSGQLATRTVDRPNVDVQVQVPTLLPPCLLNAETLATLDERAVAMLSLRKSGLAHR
jgi:hypothetical protein